MKTMFIGKNCIEIERTKSTNSYLNSLLGLQEVFEGTIVITKNQEEGRGQRGASWESEPGKNLTFSLLLYPSFLVPQDQFRLNITIALGLRDAVCNLLHAYSLSPPIGNENSKTTELPKEHREVKIKWPNDIYIGDKKVAGILIENSVSGNKLLYSIVGIGMNVNQINFSDALPNPVSLSLLSGIKFDLPTCLEEFCISLERRYLQLRGSGEMNEEYLKHLYRFKEWAEYKYKEKNIQAKIVGVAFTGKLILERKNGNSLECDFKEISYSI